MKQQPSTKMHEVFFTSNDKALVEDRSTIQLPYKSMKLVENFLLSLEDVTDASVWMDKGSIHAHVSLFANSPWCESSLKSACTKQLGAGLVPASILVVIEGLLYSGNPAMAA